MSANENNDRGLLEALIGDGRPLLLLTGVLLILFGLFAFFLSATRHFLPHDIVYLGMTQEDLCSINECRIVHFMIHDRVSFGGSLVGIGILYLWLVEFPLRERQAWAWWLLIISGALGFGSFLLYLGYGYLDTWHGIGTLGLLPIFGLGLFRTYFSLERPLGISSLVRFWGMSWDWKYGMGRFFLLATAFGLALGGLIIAGVGVTTVFVPQDLRYMGLTAEQLNAINPRLVPLIAHDRAGFGGGVCCCGVTMFFCVWRGVPSRSLWQALLLTGAAGFGTAIGVHPAIGYMEFSHLAPAYAGAALFTAGMVMTFPRMWRRYSVEGTRGPKAIPPGARRAWKRRLSPEEFRAKLREYAKRTREMILTPGDPGLIPVTKISGLPWWPAGRARPRCDRGHAMSFIAQVLLADTPYLEEYGDRLLSFHYCYECSGELNMSFGWGGPNPKGYDVTIHTGVADRLIDGLGLVAGSIVDPHSVSFRDLEEVPGYSDTCDLIENRPEDYPGGKHDFDVEIYPSVIHVPHAKLGGWPRWVQSAQWPRNRPDESVEFVLQLDWKLCPKTPWCTGYAYLFAKRVGNNPVIGELVLQTT